MVRKSALIASIGTALALSAAALMAAGQAQGGSKDTGKSKDSHAGHDHSKDGKEKGDGKAAKAAGATVGQKAPDFQFTDLAGKSHSLTEFAGKTVILEWINPGCPVCKEKVESGAVAKMMAAVKQADPTAVFIFVNSTSTDAGGSVDVSAKYLKDNKLDAIAFWEADGSVGRLYGAATTPHLFVIDKTGKLAYSGAFDDDRAEKKGVNYVVEAVKALKAGSTPSPATTKPYGCSVKYAKSKS